MRTNILAGAAMLLAVCAAATAAPFTFQGELRDGGTAVNGVYDLQFSLFGAAVSGTQFGSVLCADNVSVVNGRFTVVLDFGSVFDGTDRFLEVQLRADTGLGCGNGANFGLLGPRAQVTNAPMAGFASQAGTATNATSAANATNLNGQPATFYQNATNLTGTLADAQLSANVPKLNSASSAFTGAVSATAFTGSGAALTALNAGNLASGTVADARLSANIPKLNTSNTFAGGLTATSFSGSGALLTSLNATSVSSGVLGDGFLSTNVPLKAAANSFSAINTFNNRVGIGTAPGALLHVSNGASGATASTSSELVIEDNTSAYVQILTPDASERGVAFGSVASGFEGGVYYTNAGGMSLRTGGNQTQVVVAPSGEVTFSGNVVVPTTTRYLSMTGYGFASITNVSRVDETLYTMGGASSGRAGASVQLPHGARVTGMTIFGLDISTINFTMTLRNRLCFNSTPGTFTNMATVVSSGSSTAVSQWGTTTVTDAVIDNQNKAYMLELSFPPGALFADLGVAAVRISYTVTAPLP